LFYRNLCNSTSNVCSPNINYCGFKIFYGRKNNYKVRLPPVYKSGEFDDSDDDSEHTPPQKKNTPSLVTKQEINLEQMTTVPN